LPPPATAIAGTGEGTAAGQLDRPTSVALDAKGDLFVADALSDRVMKLSYGYLGSHEWDVHAALCAWM
jgi:hypothetical protein